MKRIAVVLTVLALAGILTSYPAAGADNVDNEKLAGTSCWANTYVEGPPGPRSYWFLSAIECDSSYDETYPRLAIEFRVKTDDGWEKYATYVRKSHIEDMPNNSMQLSIAEGFQCGTEVSIRFRVKETDGSVSKVVVDEPHNC